MVGKAMLRIAVLSMVFAVLSVAGNRAAAQEGPAPPPVRKIPGITVADPFPNACVDCHLNYEQMKLDTRFSTAMQSWSEAVEPALLEKAQASAPTGMVLKGKHPKVAGALADIPAKCLSCHGKGSKVAPPFASMIHRIHLTGGEENHFLTLFQGECTYCHKLNATTGQWTIPSGSER